MSSGTVKIGLVGCGWIAENGHVPAFKLLRNAEIIAVFDIDIGRALRLATKFGIENFFDSFNDFLQSGVDAVVITTPNYTHAKYALEALENGKHVLCEKPFTVLSSETEKIIKIAQKNRRVVIPGFVSRFRDDVKKMYEIVLNNVGKIRRVEAGWIRKAGVPRPGTWFTSKELSGGGVLIDLGSHIIDLCLMLTGTKEIKDISLLTSYNYLKNSASSARWFTADYAYSLPIDVEDNAVADIEFCDRTKIQVKLSWSAPVRGDQTYFSIFGDDGVVELKTLFGFSNQRLWQDDILTIKRGSQVETLCLNTVNNKTVDAFYNMAEFFVNAIAQGDDCGYLTLADGYNTVKLIESLYSCEKTSDLIRVGCE